MSFFSNFLENPAASMPIFGPKKFDSFKTIWAKKVNMMPYFFRITTKKSQTRLQNALSYQTKKRHKRQKSTTRLQNTL